MQVGFGAFGIGLEHYKEFLQAKEKRDKSRSLDLHYFLASYIQDHSTSCAFDLARLDAADIHRVDPYIGELVAEHTDLPATAFEKLSLLERLPLLEKTFEAVKARRESNNPGGRPNNPEVAKRRKQVAKMLTQGMKPGEVAYQLKVDPRVIYADTRRLKI